MYRQIAKPVDPKNGKCPECGNKRLLYNAGTLKCTNCGFVIGKRFNKYGAKKTTYNGIIYDSKFESQIAEDLDLRLIIGDIKNIERQVKIPLYAYDHLITNYYVDFLVTHNDGHLEYLEAKGLETDLFKIKWKMLEAKLKQEDPTAEMTLIKQKTYKKY